MDRLRQRRLFLDIQSTSAHAYGDHVERNTRDDVNFSIDNLRSSPSSASRGVVIRRENVIKNVFTRKKKNLLLRALSKRTSVEQSIRSHRRDHRRSIELHHRASLTCRIRPFHALMSSLASRARVVVVERRASTFDKKRPSTVRGSTPRGTRVAVRAASGETDPLMLRAIRGDAVERPPIWMMRQAGRYMKIYQDLCKKHTTFRERSETVDLAVEISLQPYEAFKPDGVILFSDILTPLQGMNIPFDIVKGTGPIIFNPVREMDDIKDITPLEPEKSVPFVGESLKILRNELKGTDATLLGFCGAPFTLASYIVEGGTSSHYKIIKKMAFDSPKVYEALMNKLTDAVIEYTRYQADCGAQVVQIFDSWASEFSPADFEVYCLPYLKRIVAECKQTHPHVPLILYSSGSAGFLERLAQTNADVISLDGTIDMADARARLGMNQAVQGNMDPIHLFASQDFITEKVHDTIRKAGNTRHVMNLGHGVMVGTPEENVGHFFKTVREYRY